jgi:hypothetical protein
MVSGLVDSNSYTAMTDPQRQQFDVVGALLTTTNFCHIFPPSTNRAIKQEPNDPKVLSLTPSFQCRLLI